MQKIALDFKKQGKKIALVPTMGYFHKGHLSLIEEAKKYAGVVIVSIFVNPAQFGEDEDFSSYPRDLDKDLQLCEDLSVDFVFAPNESDMYPKGYSSFVNEYSRSSGLCGAKRLKHFQGVCTVLCKLFNITQTSYSFFGEKDFQQAKVVLKMIKDMNLPIKIFLCPTIREKSGLAMSSRNKYLSNEEKKKASLIFQGLKNSKDKMSEKRTYEQIAEELFEFYQKNFIKVDYVELRHSETLELLKEEIISSNSVRIFVACFIGKARLIDNIEL